LNIAGEIASVAALRAMRVMRVMRVMKMIKLMTWQSVEGGIHFDNGSNDALTSDLSEPIDSFDSGDPIDPIDPIDSTDTIDPIDRGNNKPTEPSFAKGRVMIWRIEWYIQRNQVTAMCTNTIARVSTKVAT